jgi:hypothetical protein
MSCRINDLSEYREMAFHLSCDLGLTQEEQQLLIQIHIIEFALERADSVMKSNPSVNYGDIFHAEIADIVEQLDSETDSVLIPVTKERLGKVRRIGNTAEL